MRSVTGLCFILRYYRVGVLRIANVIDQNVIMFASISFSFFPPGSLFLGMLWTRISENSVNYSSLLAAVGQGADYIELFCFTFVPIIVTNCRVRSCYRDFQVYAFAVYYV